MTIVTGIAISASTKRKGRKKPIAVTATMMRDRNAAQPLCSPDRNPGASTSAICVTGDSVTVMVDIATWSPSHVRCAVSASSSACRWDSWVSITSRSSIRLASARSCVSRSMLVCSALIRASRSTTWVVTSWALTLTEVTVPSADTSAMNASRSAAGICAVMVE